MKAAAMFALADARGIDFTRVAGESSNVHGIAQARRGSRESVHGTPSRVYRRPDVDVADHALAARGMRDAHYGAARISFCHDTSCYKDTRDRLARHALLIRIRGKWPSQIQDCDGNRVSYIERLCELVLDVELHRSKFEARPDFYPVYLNITPDLWEHVVSHWFTDVQAEYQRWVSIALSWVQRRINENQEAA